LKISHEITKKKKEETFETVFVSLYKSSNHPDYLKLGKKSIIASDLEVEIKRIFILTNFNFNLQD
jgi:hypothetical protein